MELSGCHASSSRVNLITTAGVSRRGAECRPVHHFRTCFSKGASSSAALIIVINALLFLYHLEEERRLGL